MQNHLITPPQYPIPIVCLDPIVHTIARPFCSDLTCDCHNDLELTTDLWRRLNDGTLTPAQALEVYWGLS
jgi:hypothetical protein